MKINSLNKQKHGYLIQTWWDKSFKGTVVVNWTFSSLHGGSFESTPTIPWKFVYNKFKGFPVSKIKCYKN